MPKSLGVRTRPCPKCQAQTRLTITRAVSGFSAAAMALAKSSRPLPCENGVRLEPAMISRNCRGTLAPRLEIAERAFAATGDPMVAYAAGFVLDRQSNGHHHQETRIPLPSAQLADFVSGCWFAHGSTALLRREAFARVGETDPALRRFEDYDWFVRFALAGGRLEVWPYVAAIVEVTKKPRVSAVREVVDHLRAKYADPHGPYRLAPQAINRLEACFDFELASSLSADRKWLPTMIHLARSFWRVPRTTLHLRRLWKAP